MAYITLLSSTIPFSHNILKSILFRISSLFLQFAIYKLFSFLAFYNGYFTSYLMFDEGPYQKLLYILSRGFNRQSFLVFAFVVLFSLAALWDTVLWGLDRPGWIVKSSRVNAEALTGKMKSDPVYVVLSQSYKGVEGLDLQWDLGNGLWDGVNVTLAGVVDIGVPWISDVMNYNHSMPDFDAGPGPRIWLDDDGWSVNVDSYISVSYATTLVFECPVEYQGPNSATWCCEYGLYGGSETAFNFLFIQLATPGLWWEAGGGHDDMDELTPERGLNPWNELGNGVDSTIMKEVFTLTKGTTRHVFLMTAWKVTMRAFNNETLSMQEMEDLVDRTWQEGRDKSEQLELLDAISLAFNNDNGLTVGKRTATAYEVHSRAYQYFKIIDANTTIFSVFQVLDSNVTLIRTETIPSPPVPFGTCDTGYRNDATGGKVRASTCKIRNLDSGPEENFLGQADASAVLVIQDALGSRRAETSAAALNESGWRWFQDNNNNIDALILSRGYILGVNPGAVQIDIHNYVPAVSILQLLLVVVPFVAAAMAYVLVDTWATFHYQASLFSNLVATTHVGYNCEKPESMENPPEIDIVRKDGRVYLGTQDGALWCMTDEVPTEVKYKPGAVTWDEMMWRLTGRPPVGYARKI